MLATLTAEKNAYQVALENFDLAADALGLEQSVRAMIKYPERVLQVSVPVRMDSGKVIRFQGYRVQHSTARGPAKGGIRYHPNVTEIFLMAAARAASRATPRKCRWANWSG